MSSNHTTKQHETQSIDAEAIAEYLHQNPEFFEQHPDILAELNLTHHVNGAISLIERQVEILREQNRKTKVQLSELVQIARENDLLNERMHKLTLALMDATTLNEVFIALDDALRGEFSADAVTVKLFIDPDKTAIEPDSDLMQAILMPMSDPRLADFKHILSHEKPICGALKQEQLDYLFGDQAEQIKSTAMIPLGGDRCTTVECSYLGMLAIGSHDIDRFHSKMGTLFLSNLGEIVSRAIRPYLAAKAHE
jgi:uncharacterized protein YigA (DUF484 family)